MKKKALHIIEILREQYPDALCALHYEKDYELMIAVRLSAQCTDARVNLITPALFEAYPTLEDMANAKIEDVENSEDANLIIHMASVASPIFYRKYPIETIDANVEGLRNPSDSQTASTNPPSM